MPGGKSEPPLPVGERNELPLRAQRAPGEGRGEGSDPDHLVRIVEALVFVATEPPTIGQLADALGADSDAIERAVESLAERLSTHGVQLQRHRDTLDLVTAPDVAPWVEHFLGATKPARLSPAALETLAVIAYHQPVTRAGIEAVRGVNSDRALATLLARGLVEEIGRSDGIGRPALFATTEEFLTHFGLSSLKDLPARPSDSDDDEPPKLEVL